MSGFWIWDEEETRRYWEAGGGAAGAFATHWQLTRELARAFLDDVREQRFHGAGASVMYVVSARKPR